MAKQQNTSLVPVAKQLPATRPAETSKQSFSLYDGERHFTAVKMFVNFYRIFLARRLPAHGLTLIFVPRLIKIHAAR